MTTKRQLQVIEDMLSQAMNKLEAVKDQSLDEFLTDDLSDEAFEMIKSARQSLVYCSSYIRRAQEAIK